jgi:hypothetical protein
MRFNSLSLPVQTAISRTMVDHVSTAPADLQLPVVPATAWLAAFRKLNVKIAADKLPTSASMWLAIEYLEAHSNSPCECVSCGKTF